MTNIFIETTTYINEATLKDSTKETWLQWSTLTDINNRDILIRKSEIIIDSIIQSFWVKLNESQETIFPTVDDGIPTNIKKATVLLCEEQFKGWELTSWSLSNSRIVSSEKYWNHQVTYQDVSVAWNTLQKKNKYITQEIETLLKPYINVVWSKWSKSVI